ncbi:MAG: hypothetical protein CVU39_04025 [Chloroflexi bacterium HGW-Chloroflexi-10]|nr:MAG: hypothetical protein CVU39_04025 [Chloroflexi bacterium HGW-Chloroflexi-10]
MALISYHETDEAWRKFKNTIIQYIQNESATKICEIGGGANPVLTPQNLLEFQLEYTIIDVSKEELDKAPASYKKIVGDINSPEIATNNEKYDLVFSKMLAEHIKNGKQFHENILELLADNGIAIHFFPTLYTFPFFINRLTPEAFTQKLLSYFDPRNNYKYAKFPAYYSWCRGPVPSQIKKFEDLGYTIIEYRGFFGHSGYYKRLPFFRKIHETKTKYLLKNPNPFFTSYAYLIMKKGVKNDGSE